METLSQVSRMVMAKKLDGLIRGLRAHRENESEYIANELNEIREELRDPDMKVVAVQKLTYLQMLGYDINWAAFHVIEVMSMPSFTNKCIGYLAATQSFRETTDVLVLTTALMKRDMMSPNQFEAGLALSCLATICTPDLARDLASDVVAILNSSRPYIRKRAVLCLYKIFLQFPDALRPAFPRLKDKLSDADVSVVSASINVIYELARHNPSNYLPLAPIFYQILTTSNNNWMLIKIIKLFAQLNPLQPRLAKKLVEPLTNLINNTQAMSLLYECIRTVSVSMTEFMPLVRLCISKLRAFVEDADQNLKYLGLLALYNIMKVHPKAVGEHRDMIVWCLDDEDVTIRRRALDLLAMMVTKRNVMDITNKLLEKLDAAEGDYKDDLVLKIINICSQDTYKMLTNFEWYIVVLLELSQVRGTQHGALIAHQMRDVIVRVKIVRKVGVKHMVDLLHEHRLFNTGPGDNSVVEVLNAAAWTVGELCEFVTNHTDLIGSLLQSRATTLPGHIQATFVLNAQKLFVDAVSRNRPDIAQICEICDERLHAFKTSAHLETQERACFFAELIGVYREAGGAVFGEIAAIQSEPLKPVHPRTQRRVPLPDDLDLDTPINDLPESDEDLGQGGFGADPYGNGTGGGDGGKGWDFITQDRDKTPTKQKSRPRAGDNIFILGGDTPQRPNVDLDEHEIEVITDADLNLEPSESNSRRAFLRMASQQARQKNSGETRHGRHGGRHGRHRRGKHGRRRRGERSPSPEASGEVEILADEDVPEGMTFSDDEKDHKNSSSSHNPLGTIDLTGPLDDHESLPVPQHRQVARAAPAPESTAIGGGVHESTGGASGEGKRERHHRRRRGEKGDHKGRHRRHRRRHGEKKDDRTPPAGASTGTTTTSSLASGGSLIDIGGGAPTPAATATTTPAVTAPVTSAPAIATATGPSSSSSSSSRHRGRSSSSKAPLTVPPQPIGIGPRPLVQVGTVTAYYEIKAAATEPKRVLVAVYLANSGSAPVTGVEFTVTNVPQMQLSQQSPPSSVPPGGQTQVHQLLFAFESLVQPLSVTAVLKDASGGSAQCQFSFPCSSFLLPIAVTTDQFQQLIGNQSLSSKKVRCKVARSDLGEAFAQLRGQLQLHLVEAHGHAAMFYGQSVQKHHVAVLVKGRSRDGQVDLSVDVKSSDATLAKSVAAQFDGQTIA